MNKKIKEATSIMKDAFRLNYHLMPPHGWMNDPNGLVKIGDTYHIYYQYSPNEPEGGLKYWGHYTTKNFVQYKNHGIALSPDHPFDKDGVYSGSAFKTEDEEVYYYYTGNVIHEGNYDYNHEGREQNTILTTSKDGFRFSKKQLLLRNDDYGAGLSNHVRDPKVFKEDDAYYMVLGARTSEDIGCVLLFTSKNLTDWQQIHKYQTREKFGYMWECPDLVKLEDEYYLICCPQGVKQDGYRYEAVYQNGYFKIGKNLFEKEYLDDFVELDYGHDYYAPQSFSDGPRTIQLAWMGLPDIPYSNPTVANGWQHALTIPRELTVKDGKIYQTPIKELKKLRRNELHMSLTTGRKFDCASSTCEVQVTGVEGAFKIKMGSMHLDFKDGLLTVTLDNGYGRPKKHIEIDEINTMAIFYDTSSIELFINEGEKVFTTRVYDKKSPVISCDQNVSITYFDLYSIEVEE